ncbi:MAG TPA: BadF/BadG/BcrA/BcrD ATPase family protein [Abditibacteriaceae bacterium]|nr:BadF/BadG/BcrA/BcrD ATPase family protein [Abditibacteriaceae bacterium]
MTWRVGVDGGGTTTRAVVINENREILGRGEAASSNLYNVGLEVAVQNVETAIERALQQASLEVERVASFGFGLAGAVGTTEKTRWHNALRPLFGAQSSTRIVVEEDGVAALAGAFGGAFGGTFTDSDDELSGGVILISGTGVNCFGQNTRGERARADGWGPLLGDRGSGYWIGEAAMRAALAAADGAAPVTTLQNAVLEHFQADDWNALVGVVYAPDFRRERIAALVPRVLDAAQHGDAVSQQLLETAGQNLAHTAAAILTKLGVHRLAPTGGLLENADTVRRALEETLRRRIPQLEWVKPQFEAVVGAAILGDTSGETW